MKNVRIASMLLVAVAIIVCPLRLKGEEYDRFTSDAEKKAASQKEIPRFIQNCINIKFQSKQFVPKNRTKKAFRGKGKSWVGGDKSWKKLKIESIGLSKDQTRWVVIGSFVSFDEELGSEAIELEYHAFVLVRQDEEWLIEYVLKCESLEGFNPTENFDFQKGMWVKMK